MGSEKNQHKKNLPYANIVNSAPSWSWVAINAPVTYAWTIGWGLSPYYPISKVTTISDAEIIDIVPKQCQTAQSYRPNRNIQMWSNVVSVSYTALEKSEVRLGCRFENPGYCNLRKQAKRSPNRVRCALEFSCDRLDDIICARIASWEHDLGDKDFRGLQSFHRPTFTYCLVLQRVRRPRKLFHPLDRGLYRRVGLGADEAATVDEFFRSSSRCFLTIA